MGSWLVILACGVRVQAPPPAALPAPLNTHWTSPQAREAAMVAEIALLRGDEAKLESALTQLKLYDNSIAARIEAFELESRLLIEHYDSYQFPYPERLAGLIREGEELLRLASGNPDLMEQLGYLKVWANGWDAGGALVQGALQLPQEQRVWEQRFFRICRTNADTSCLQIPDWIVGDRVAEAEGELRGKKARQDAIWAKLALESMDRDYPQVPLDERLDFLWACSLRPKTAIDTLESMEKRNPTDPDLKGILAIVQLETQKSISWPEAVLLQTQAGIAAAEAGDVELARAQLRSALALAPSREAAIALVGLGIVPGDVTWLLPAQERWPLDPVLAGLEL